MAHTRLERNGKVAYTNGKTTLVVPSEAACREKLTELLASGDSIEEFWMERAKDMADSDELKAAWATEVWQRLDKIWDELVPPEVPEEDIFAMFGLGG